LSCPEQHFAGPSTPSGSDSKGVTDHALGQYLMQQLAELRNDVRLKSVLLPQIASAGLAVLGFVQLGPPKQFLAFRVPAEIDLLQRVVVSQENDLGS